MSGNFVTGGAGFIGGALVQALVKRGESVTVFDVKTPETPVDGVTYIEGSITDAAFLARAMKGASAVFHVAGDPRLWRPDPAGYQEVNTRGAVNVLAAAENAGAGRVVHTSSITVYVGRGSDPSREAGEEAAENMRPDDLFGDYARSKWMADQAALEAARSGLSVSIVAPTMPVGPGDAGLTPPSLMLLDFLRGGTPAYLEANMNLIDVRDLALGYISARDRGRAGARYLMGGHAVAMSEMLKLLAKASGRGMPRGRVPGVMAEAFAGLETWMSDRITRKPPKAPLAGVQIARAAPRLSNRAAAGDLGLACRPLAESLADAVEDFQRRRLI